MKHFFDILRQKNIDEKIAYKNLLKIYLICKYAISIDNKNMKSEGIKWI